MLHDVCITKSDTIMDNIWYVYHHVYMWMLW